MKPADTEGAALEQPVEVKDRASANHVLALVRLFSVALMTLYCFLGSHVARALAGAGQRNFQAGARWTRRWLIGGRKIMGIKIHRHGEAPPSGALIAPNHTGYLDLIAIGSQLDCLFVAKSEMNSWPLAGAAFRSSGGIAAPRIGVKALRKAIVDVAEQLSSDVSVCIFLEGTSSGGASVQEFHASFLEASMKAQAPVVPVALNWRAADSGIDISEDIAYWKDHVLVPHFWRMAGLRGIEVDVVFGDPIYPDETADRREFAALVQSRVAKLLKGVRGLR